MMKKNLLLLLVLLFPSAIWALAVGEKFTESTIEGVEMTFKVLSETDKTCQVGQGLGFSVTPAISQATTGTVTIPQTTQNGYQVISIGENAFYDCTGVTAINVPASVMTVGGSAFTGTQWYDNQPEGVVYAGKVLYKWKGTMTSGTNIYIKEGTKAIAEDAFENCSKITGVTFPEGLVKIGSYAFKGCSGISAVALPSTLKSIDSYAFYNCTNLSSVTIPDDITSVGVSAFKNTSWVNGYKGMLYIGTIAYQYCGTMAAGTSVDIKEGTTCINAGCFNGLSNLAAVTIPTSVTSIGDNAFSNCKGLSSIEIPASVTSIGWRAFSGCILLKSVAIPNQVKLIKHQIFYGCTNLESVTIPASITSIELEAFGQCPNISTISIDAANTAYDSRDNCNAIIETATNTLLFGCNGTVIPEGVTTIRTNAFIYAAGLTEVTIPKSVTELGPDLFASDNKVKSVTVLSKTPPTISVSTFYGVNGYDCATLYVPYGCMAVYQAADYWKDFYTIKESDPVPGSQPIEFADAKVKALCVANWDTDGNGELSEEEAAAVTDLGSVFYGNTEITSFHELKYFTGLQFYDQYGTDNTYSGITGFAFSGCKNLQEVTLPEVEAIGDAAFMNSGLTAITLPGTVKIIRDGAFDGTNISSFVLPASVTDITYGIIEDCPNLESVVVEDGNSVYDSRDNCNAIIRTADNTLIIGCAKTTIPASVTSLNAYAFQNCKGLGAVELHDNVTSIGTHAFASSGITSLTIGKGVSSIASNAFCNLENLSSITIDKDNATFDSRDNCNAIVRTADNTLITGCGSTVIPASVTVIGENAFNGCANLTSINIPSSVTTIGNNAFLHCANLQSVIVGWLEPIKILDAFITTYYGNEATLYVPAGSKAAYQAANYWKAFKAIKEFPDNDVNQDGEVDIVDVVDIARYVVGTPAETFDKYLADLNSDNAVDVADAVLLVNTIAGDVINASRRAAITSSDGVLSLTQNADHSLSFSLEGNGMFTAFQFDLKLPENTDVAQMALNSQRKQKHQLLYNKVDEGHYRVVALSTSNRTFNGTAGELLNIVTDGLVTDDITIENIHFVTVEGQNILFDTIGLSDSTPTGIVDTKNDAIESDHPIYNVNGQRLATPQKGLNIINGKKVIIK